MKSSLLKRKKPLVRKTPLRARPRRFTAEQKAAHRDYVAARAIAYERDGGTCRVPGLLHRLLAQSSAMVVPGWLRTACHGRVDPHHLATQQHAPELIADVDNLRCICRWHHEAIHSHPAEAKRLGLLR